MASISYDDDTSGELDVSTKARLDVLKYYARRIHERSAPDLSPAELDKVLEWELIPTNATEIYEYAMFVRGFQTQLCYLDPNLLDAKTLRLIQTTLQKIGFGEREAF